MNTDDAFSQAHRLALELECLLLSCTDTAATAKWWDSAHEALEQWRKFCAGDPPAVDSHWPNIKMDISERKTHPAIEPALSAARSLTDELMDCVDRLGSEYDTVDPRVWEHILVYAKPVGAAPLPCGRCNGSGWVVRDPDIGTDQECFVCEGRGVIEGAPVTLPDDVRPQDLKIDCMFTQLGGGFAPILNNGIRVTHLPTGIVIEETGARSQHRNRAIAIERLKNELAKQNANVTPLPDDVAQMVEALRRHEWVPVIQQAADMIEHLARQLQEVKDWNAMLADHNEQLAQRGDDLEERLARQVPEGCVVVPREPTEAMFLAAKEAMWVGNIASSIIYKAMLAAGQINLNQGETK